MESHIEIEQLLEEGELQVDPDPRSTGGIRGASIRLHAGKAAYRPGPDGQPPDRIDLEKAGGLDIKPGEFRILETQEELHFSNSIAGLLGSKFTLAAKGLVLLNGHVVEPGFRDQMILTVFNSGPKPLEIRFQQEIAVLTINRLKTPVAEGMGWARDRKNRENRIGEILRHVSQSHHHTLQSIPKVVKDLGVRVTTCKEYVDSEIDKVQSQLSMTRWYLGGVFGLLVVLVGALVGGKLG